jgi:hypothetical protein
MLNNTNNQILKESQVLTKGQKNMKDNFVDEISNEIVANDNSASGTLSEVVQCLDKLNGVGRPSDIAQVLYGTKTPTSKEKKKVRNVCQNKGLAQDSKRAIKIDDKRYLLLLKNHNGRERNLYKIARDEKHAKQLAKQG